MSVGLGIDPGLANLGYAVMKVENLDLLEVGLMQTSPNRKLDVWRDFDRRSAEMAGYLIDMAREIKPKFLAYEGFSYTRQARSSAMLALSHGHLVMLAEQLGIRRVAVSRTDVLRVVQVRARGRGRKQRRAQIKKGVIQFALEEWDEVDWSFRKDEMEHPADAAVTVFTALKLSKYGCNPKINPIVEV